MTKTVYDIFVNGIPKAQPRPRRARNGGVYNPPSADAWKAAVKAAFIPCRRALITEPVSLRMICYLPMPNRVKAGESSVNPYAKKPDIDNLLKSTMDAMTEAGIWKDDALVYAIKAEKWYAPENKIGAHIIVETDIEGANV